MAAAALAGVRHIEVPQFADPRGELAAFEQLRPLPFAPVRAFVISEVPQGMHRAQHLVSCDQFLWMIAGSCEAIVRAGAESSAAGERRFQVRGKGPGLFLPEGVWLDLMNFAPGSALLCLAAAKHDPQRKR